MNVVKIMVTKCPEGWFVHGYNNAGPFLSKQHAMCLAHGMAFTIATSGDRAELLICERATPYMALATDPVT